MLPVVNAPGEFIVNGGGLVSIKYQTPQLFVFTLLHEPLLSSLYKRYMRNRISFVRGPVLKHSM